MGGELGDLRSLLPSKKSRKTVIISAKGVPSQSKRALANTETDVAKLKKQRLVLGSGSGKDARKDKVAADKVAAEKAPTENEAPPKDVNAEDSSHIPFIFAPQTKQGKPVLLTDSVRANPRLGLPLLQGVCLPEDMKQLPYDLEGNIVDMFSHLTLANQSLLGYHQKVVNLSSSFNALKLKYKDALQKKREAENDLAAAKLQLLELDEAKKQLSELESLRAQVKDLQEKLSEEGERTKKAVSEAHLAGFNEAKEKVIEHYRGQVSEIQSYNFRKGAKIYYFKGVAKGYGLGLEAGSVPAESALRTVPEVESPEIEIPLEEEDEEAEEEDAEENVDENTEAAD